jgi:predicted ATPase
MSKIKIRNFGPIKEGCGEDDGWIEVKKVTLFIGNQGSGKSTVAKLISTFTWMEKALVRGDFDGKWLGQKNRLKKTFLTYHRLENYFISDEAGNEITEIEYIGDAYHIRYKNFSLQIDEIRESRYILPQIMYVPAERNLVAYVKSPKELRLSSDSLKEYVTEFDKAKNAMKGSMSLPINNVVMDYDKLNDVVNVRGEGYKVFLAEASSGFQSLVPLYLVSWFLSNAVQKGSEVAKEPMSSEEEERFRKLFRDILDNSSYTDEQRRLALSELPSRFNKSAFINIVEEAEQNLYPGSQWKMLGSLLAFNNMNPGNKLIMTSHSPYLVSYLSIAIQGKELLDKVNQKSKLDLFKDKISNILPLDSLVDASDVIVYQLDEKKGNLTRLENPDGIPSDKNLLNMMLREGNQLFDSLLEIEEEL